MSTQSGSIKGVAIRSAVQDLAALLDSGRVPAKVAVTALGDAERAMLANAVQDDAWYPLACFDRICRLLLEYDGRGNADYFVMRGRAAAERLLDAGVFKQVDFVRRIGEQSTFEQVALYMRLAGTIWSGLFDFGSFRLANTDAFLRFEVGEAEPISDMLAEAVLGFILRVSEEATGGVERVTYSRPREDLIHYTFELTEAAARSIAPPAQRPEARRSQAPREMTSGEPTSGERKNGAGERERE